MPTIKELGIREGQQVFCFAVEREMPSGGTMGGLHLADAMADPNVTVQFAQVELLKRGKLSNLYRIICTNHFSWTNIDRSDFPDVIKTEDITSLHNGFPNYIVDGIGPEIKQELSVGIPPTDEPFEKRSNLMNPEGEIVGELIVNNQGLSWTLEMRKVKSLK